MTVELDWKGETPDQLATHLKTFGDRLQNDLTRILNEAVLRVQAMSARLSPVDTGRLRASISSAVETLAGMILEGVIGSNVPYAAVQEFHQPYLRPSVEAIWPWLRQETEQAVYTAWRAT